MTNSFPGEPRWVATSEARDLKGRALPSRPARGRFGRAYSLITGYFTFTSLFGLT